MALWAMGEVDELIESRLSNDATIKTKMGIATGKARVAGYFIPRDPKYFDPPYPFFIYFYPIPMAGARVNGNRIIQHNVNYDIEVRTLGAPTSDSEAVVDRVQALMTMVSQLTSSGNWVVSSSHLKPIMKFQRGETPEVYYTRRGGTYGFAIAPA